ncbi:hypothetical protein BVX98_05875 [bacterium F11]|nr:hypothetical protein BVX98_05875 [bacterium F11]
MDFIQGTSREQILLLPESIDDFITEDNPVRFIEAFVDSLPLKKLGFKSLPNTGRPPYRPADLLKLYLYGYTNAIRFSRRLEREANRNLELIWLLKKLKPDFKTIADFRKNNANSLQQVCRQFTLLCKEENLFGSEFVAIDGTKIQAVNSNQKNITERRLKRDLEAVDKKVSDYFRDLDFYDQQETSHHKKVSVKELKEKIKYLEKEKKKLEEQEDQLRSSPDGQISFTDPDSRAMMMGGVTDVGYNCQTVVDDKHHMIVEHEVINNPTDQNQLHAMAHRAKTVLGVKKLDVVADRGYYNGYDIMKCEEDNITVYTAKPETSANKKHGLFHKDLFIYDSKKDTYQCPAGETLIFRSVLNEQGRMTRYYVTSACRQCPLKSKCTRGEQRRLSRWEHDDVMDHMRERVRGKPDIMIKRKCLVEHPYGTMKRWWDQGYFVMKGLRNVRAEFSLSVFSYNFKRAINILGVKRLVQAVS